MLICYYIYIMKNLIVYDFDGTIYDGDSSVDFFIFCIKKYPSLLLHIIYIMPYFMWHYIGKIDITTFKEKVFSFLTKIENTKELVDLFWEENQNKIKKFYLEKEHKNELIISASPYFLLSPLKEKFGFDLIASDVDIKTGKFNKPNCRGKEKISRMDETYKEYKVLEMYSDSLHDKPLLDLADKAYFVVGDNLYNYDEYNFNLKNKLKERYHRHRELYSYLITGVLTTLINFILYFSLRNVIGIIYANIIAFIGAVLFAYITNKIYVFESTNNSVKESILFFTMRIVTLVIETILLYLMSLVIFNGLAKVLVSIINIILNYIFSKFIIFKGD